MKGGDASAIDGFLGPWAKYQDEKDVAKPTEVSCNNHLLQCSLESMKSYRINSSLFNSFFFHNFICLGWQEEQKELDEITAKRQKKGKNEEEAPGEEKTILHGEIVISLKAIVKCKAG